MQQEDPLSTFRAAGKPSVNFHQLSVQPEDLLSTSVNTGMLYLESGINGHYYALT